MGAALIQSFSSFALGFLIFDGGDDAYA